MSIAVAPRVTADVEIPAELEKVQAALSKVRSPEKLRVIVSQVRTSSGCSRRILHGARLAYWMTQQGTPFIALSREEWEVLVKFGHMVDIDNDPAILIS